MKCFIQSEKCRTFALISADAVCGQRFSTGSDMMEKRLLSLDALRKSPSFRTPSPVTADVSIPERVQASLLYGYKVFGDTKKRRQRMSAPFC